MQFPEKLMNLTWENGEKLNLDPILACLAQMLSPPPQKKKKKNWGVLPQLVVRHCSKLSSYAS